MTPATTIGVTPSTTETNSVETLNFLNSLIAYFPNSSLPTPVTTALLWPYLATPIATLVGLPPTAFLNVCGSDNPLPIS
ncbi:unannotated protein [freshwater metagenome]|uniref:Unannotated protein n=1 Tax=freshwater metagenome TaxID=449393 RepID=A0A6J7KH33_9ZZZZ